ncbi:MAG TPA: hypothetical protein VE074_00835 [Jatrophihabitantaceae bacterium]|nr:hypothetical protein [Jatrophihabitantaceae bacterium]
MNDQQLETVLRRSLSHHAGTVDSGPVWAPDAEELTPHPGRRPVAWWPIAAAIIAVLAVVGVVVAIRHLTSDRRHPDSPVIVTRSACTTNLPPVWQNAIVAGTHTGQDLLGGGPNGEVVVQRHVGTQLVTALIGADGSTRTILELPFDGPYKTGNAAIDRQWILLPIIKWTTTPQTISRFDLVDRATLKVVQEIPIGKNPATSAPALFQNHVYWVQQAGARGGGSVIDYDVARRTKRTLAAGTVQDLIDSPLGVGWQDAAGGTHLVAGSAPDRVPGLRGTHPQLVSNGHDYAWPSGTGIVWYSDATKQTIVVQRVVPDGGGIDVAAVAGPFVLVRVDFNASSSARIIDTRTGTATILDSPGGTAAGAGDILAYSAPDTVVLHTDRLPALTC